MIFGIDVSTSVVGVACFTNDGKFLSSHFCDLRKVEPDLIKKGRVVESFLTSLFSGFREKIDYDDDKIFVEDRLSNFSAGKTMLQTLMKLGAFNTLVSWLALNALSSAGRQRSSPPKLQHLHPSTVKSIMKKEGLVIMKGQDKKKLTLDFVVKREPTFPLVLNKNGNPQPYCYDMADGFITGRAGYLMQLGLVKEKEGPRKSSG